MAAISDESVAKATGKTWDEWYAILDKAGAKGMTHQEIVGFLYNGHIDNGWWCHSVSGAYERRIGRRADGQTCSGDFSASASKTFAASLDEVLELWRSRVDGAQQFNGVEVVEEPQVRVTDKFRYWRAKLADGGRVSVSISKSGSGKTSLGVSHDKLTNTDEVESWKAYWRKLVKDM